MEGIGISQTEEITSAIVSNQLSAAGVPAATLMEELYQACPPPPKFSSPILSSDLHVACSGESDRLCQLSKVITESKKGQNTTDSVLMTVTSPLPLVPLHSGDGGREPHYNLRPLATRKGKELVAGGLATDEVSIGPKKLRGRKSDLSKAKMKAIIDIAGGKQLSLPEVLRAKQSPPEGFK